MGIPLGGRAQGDLRRSTAPSPSSPASSAAPSSRRLTTATTVRVRDGETLTTDGPFAETKEVLGGFFLFEADNLDDAIAIAAPHPRRPHGRGRGAAAGGALIEQVFRDEWGRVLATLIGFLGDFDLAEEAAQEAFAIAAERWPRDGVPANPGAWLVTTARNRAIDRLRRDRTLAAKTQLLAPHGCRQEDDVDDIDLPRRAARADLHVLPPGARARRAGRADAAHARRADDGRDRPRVPRPRADDGAAAGAREAEDQHGGDPVPRAARRTCSRTGSRRCSRSSTSCSTRAIRDGSISQRRRSASDVRSRS